MMNVLSLFDGVGGARLALDRAGIFVDKYFSSEIDPHAISVMRKHYPDTIELGDVRNIRATDLPKIDLLIGGSPCQSFSRCGYEKGFDDPRGQLMLEYIRLFKELSPRYFLLENVMMSKESVDIISELLGVRPHLINSDKFSAQMRKRLYWTNIPIGLVTDKNIMLEDVVDKDALVDRDKAHAIIASIGRTTHREYFKKNQGQVVYHAISLSNIYGGFGETRPRIYLGKSPTIRTASGGGHIPSLIINGVEKEFTLEEFKKFIRKINPEEAERLQTYPSGWTKYDENGTEICATHRYRLIGNSYTVGVVQHILEGIKDGWF